jgi:tRNA-specific 2-thiouridylase
VGREKSKVAVALSGGVDSSLTALMLMEQGLQVVGLSLRLGQGPDSACQAGARVARELGIAHRVVDAAAQFDSQVMQWAIKAFASGRTPNPCARCNARVKIPLLWHAAQEAGCDRLATGHYARLTPKPGGMALEQGVDRGKSQAYFLARLRPEQLKGLVFPLGHMTKSQVRQAAAKAGLSAAESPDSQDACFLPAGGWDEIMAKAGAVKPGSLVNEEGRVLAKHGGLHRFTIGQRRGLGVALGVPHYVLALDGQSAQVMVGPAESLKAHAMKGAGAIWHEDLATLAGLWVRLRYTHPGAGCRVIKQGCIPDPENDKMAEVSRMRRTGSLGQSLWGGKGNLEEDILIEFDEPQQAVAPGQLAVFFTEDRVAGSAWITESIKYSDGR